ncbi:MAG: TOBE domain-containing protein [Acidobacteriota bacterium]
MDWLSAREAAKRLGVGYSTFKQWIYQGSVRTTRTRGGHHRVSTAEVDRLLDESGRPTPRVSPPRPTAGPAIVALSTRNQLRGIIEEVRTDGLLAQVRLRVGDNVLTAVITRDAVTSLRLKRGRPAIALIKSTEVMIGCEPEERAVRRRRLEAKARGSG